MGEERTRKPNRLIREKSLYLLQHAYNPVDWYPWEETALAKAKRENKLIFLSIGYSTCHWCHVMEKESYEDEETARIINENFIPIKVDREERPDLDEIYMKSVLSLIGQGGWPLNVFLTPDLKPFYGGTYFPPVERQGLQSFKNVLKMVSDTWQNRQQEVLQQADQITDALQHAYSHKAEGELSDHWFDDAFVRLVNRFDQVYGGFGGAPKFPTPSNLLFLLRYHNRSKNSVALKMALKTLEMMADGGINDQLAGGFHRYSVDRRWLIPHFEKMLYDNALLAKTYLEAYLQTYSQKFYDASVGTLDWILAEMTSKEGGFYSAQDADSPEGEGAYYVWSRTEIVKTVGAIVADYFGVQDHGNFEHDKSVLSIATTIEALARKNGVTVEETTRVIEESKRKLSEERRGRTKPLTDDKILTSWNGLAISAFAYGYQVLENEKYLNAGVRAAKFIMGNLSKNGTLLRRHRSGNASIGGTLEDYAFFIQGLLDLYEADFSVNWLEEAVRLSDRMIELFWDTVNGGFFFNPPHTNDLIVRIKEAYDGATPSGNSVAALDMLRLAEYTGKETYREKGGGAIKAFSHSIENEPTAYTQMLCALDFLLGKPKEIVISGDSDMPLLKQMLREVRRRYIPNKVVALANREAERIIPFVQGRISTTPTAYVCENFACKAPSTSIESLKSALEE